MSLNSPSRFTLHVLGIMFLKSSIRAAALELWEYEKAPVTNTTNDSTMPKYKFDSSTLLSWIP